MSEFWKKRRPQLSDEEERALWERVRTMPSDARGAARRRSPWSALWARPAMRFGAPVLAVALVAIVWVAQREPAAPRRGSASGELGTTATREMEQAVPQATNEVAPLPEMAPGAAPAPVAGHDSRMAKDVPARVADEMLSPAAPAEKRAEGGNRARIAEPEAAKEATGFAEPPAPSTEPADRKDEAGRVSAKASATQPLAAARGEVEQAKPEMQAMRVAPDPEALLASRVRAIERGDFTSLLLEDVVRPESGGPFRVLLSRPTRGGRVVVTRDADGRWSILTDPGETQGPLVPPRLLQSRTGLAVELIEGIQAGDSAEVEHAGQVARRLFEGNPRDPGTRELTGWASAAKEAH